MQIKDTEIQKQITALNEQIDLLDKKFYFYFIARDKFPPLKDLIKIKADIEKLKSVKDRIILDRKKFVINSFMHRFVSYRTKWEKALKEIEDGRAKPNPEFFSKKNNGVSKEKKAAAGEVAKEKYGLNFDIILGDLKQSDDLRVLDYNGHNIMELFPFKTLGNPLYYE